MGNVAFSRLFARAFCSSTILALASSPALAQSADPVFPSREQIQLPDTDVAPVDSRVTVNKPDLRPVPCAFEGSGLNADLRSVRFTDASGGALPPAVAALLTGISPARGQRPLTQMCDLRDAAAARLSNSGYLAAVTIPQQNIDNASGAARLDVILARIVDIEVVGDAGAQASRVAARAERLKSLFPVRTQDLERELLIAADNPGLDIQMNLVAANRGTPGEVIGRLAVRPRTFSVTANASNYGSKALGRGVASLRAEVYGLTGLADVTFFGVSSTLDFEEQVSVQAGHYMTFDNGLTFGGSLALARSRPDIGLPLRSKSLLGSIEAYAPVLRTVASRAIVGGGLEIINQEGELRAGGASFPLTRDKLRVAFLKAEGSSRELNLDGTERLSFGGSIQLRKGLDIFDASERGEADEGYFPSRLEGDPTAMLVRGGLSSRLRAGPFLLSGQLQAQYSAKPLLSFEEYSVGNYTIGRGYDPASTSGDSALAARVQPSVLLGSGQTWFEPYAFYDAVRIWNHDSMTSEDGRTLKSAGLGLRAYFLNRFVIDGTWARPFDRPLDLPGVERAPRRFLISLSTSFGPSVR
jgi:hemolysin activation/secretion protein